MDSDEHACLYGNPENIVQYMDYQDNAVPDNSTYIPDLVPGMLQPLEVIEEDVISDKDLSELDIEQIVQESEECMKNVHAQSVKQMSCFAEPVSAATASDFSKKYAPSTKKKALWAGRIFEQWKCIRNFKLKQQGVHLEKLITKNLLTMEILELNEVLSIFLLEIRK